MKPKLFLILICAIVLIAAVPRDVDEVARPDVSITLTPVSYGYPAPVLEMWLALAERIASDMYDWTYREPDPAVALRVYNELLRTAGLPEIEAK